MSNYSLGRAEGEIALKYNPTGGAAAKKDLASIEASASRKTGPAIDRLGTQSMVAGGLIAAGLSLALNAAANFQQRLSGIQAVSGATGAQMALVSKKALQLGKDTKFSATEAAQAIEELVKAGISLPDVLNGAADAVVALAAAGEIDLPQAATIAANAMNVFKLSAKDMPGVADLIAGAANASAIDVGQFGQSLAQAGAAAALAGFDFKDLATGIALMGNAGIKGSDAGTSLKTMFLNLNPQTKKQIKLMKDLGIVTKEGSNRFFDASGNAKSLADIAGILQTSLKGMTRQQKLSTLEILFGSDAIRAAAVVADQGKAGFDKMSAAMLKVKAADVAAVRMKNLKGQIEQMKGSVETAAIVFGTLLIPRATQLAKSLEALANWFSNMSPASQSMTLSILSSAAGMLLFMGITVKIVKLIKDFVVAMKTIAALKAIAPIIKGIGIAMKFLTGTLLTNPIFLMVAGLVLLGVALFLAYKRSQTFRNIVQAVFGWLRDNVGPILQGIVGAVVSVFNTVVAAARAFGSAMVIAFNAVMSAVRAFASAMVVAWNAIWVVLGPVVRLVFAAIVLYFRVWWAIVSGIFKAGIAIVMGIVAGIRTILPIVTAVFNLLRAIFMFFFQVIRVVVILAMIAILWAIRGGLIAIKAIWNAVWGAISAIVRAVWGVISNTVSTAVNRVTAVIRTGMNAARTVISAVTNAIRAIWFAFWASTIGRLVQTGIRLVLSTVGRLVGIVAVGARIVGQFGAAVGKGFAGVVASVAVWVGRMIAAVAGMAGAFFNAGVAMITALINGITSRIQAAVNAIKGLADRLMGFLPGSPVKVGPLRVLNQGHAGREIIQMVIDGMLARRAALEAATRSVLLPLPNVGLGVTPALAASASRTATRYGAAVAPASRTYAPNVTVNNPPPVSGERQVLDALRRIEALYNPLGVLGG